MAINEIDIQEVKDKNRGAGQFWFSSGAMRFFNSRVGSTAYKDKSGRKAYFISSEKYDYKTPRKYSIRVADLNTGNINTIGDFQEFRTRASAMRRLKEIVG